MKHSVLRGKNNLQSNTPTFTHNTKKKTIKLNNFKSDIVAICSYNFVYSFGCFPIKYIYTDPPLISGHLDIKDAQCAKNKDGRKFTYIISRLDAAGVLKGCFKRQNIDFFFKVA